MSRSKRFGGGIKRWLKVAHKKGGGSSRNGRDSKAKVPGGIRSGRPIG